MDKLYFTGDNSLYYGVPSPAYTQGSISFKNDVNVGIDDVEVVVVASYITRDGLRGIDVCTLYRPDNEQGIGIFVRSASTLMIGEDLTP